MYCQRLEKKTFNPTKNYFDIEEVFIKRPSTDIEKDLSNKIDKYSTVIDMLKTNPFVINEESGTRVFGGWNLWTCMEGESGQHGYNYGSC